MLIDCGCSWERTNQRMYGCSLLVVGYFCWRWQFVTGGKMREWISEGKTEIEKDVQTETVRGAKTEIERGEELQRRRQNKRPWWCTCMSGASLIATLGFQPIVHQICWETLLMVAIAVLTAAVGLYVVGCYRLLWFVHDFIGFKHELFWDFLDAVRSVGLLVHYILMVIPSIFFILYIDLCKACPARLCWNSLSLCLCFCLSVCLPVFL